MRMLTPAVPFFLGAPSMVYGEDLIENIEILSIRVDHIEIVLFDTFQCNNFPTSLELDRLAAIGQERKITYSIHLPASLEPAAEDDRLREVSLTKTSEIIQACARLHPTHYVLHLPFSKPTLVPVPGLYFPWQSTPEWTQWELRARDSTAKIREFLDRGDTLLLENINYSPRFLEPFLAAGTCGLCLDIGHLLLGGEDILGLLDYFFDKTLEIHLHGVDGYQEHLSLSRLPFHQVQAVVGLLHRKAFQGPVILEVFDAQDFVESLSLVHQALALAQNI